MGTGCWERMRGGGGCTLFACIIFACIKIVAMLAHGLCLQCLPPFAFCGRPSCPAGLRHSHTAGHEAFLRLWVMGFRAERGKGRTRGKGGSGKGKGAGKGASTKESEQQEREIELGQGKGSWGKEKKGSGGI